MAALEWGCNAESSLPLPPEAVVNKSNTVTHLDPKLSTADWKREQTNDPDIDPVLILVEMREYLQYKSKSTDSQDQRILLNYRKDLVVKNGLLYKKANLKYHVVIMQFVLPKIFRKRTLQALHDDMGHMGMDRTLRLLQERFFWPKLNDDGHSHIHSW